jgi:hypothetical protein
VHYKGLYQKLTYPVKGYFLPHQPNLIFLPFLGRTNQNPQNPVSSGSSLSCFSNNLSAFYKNKSVSGHNRTTFFIYKPARGKTCQHLPITYQLFSKTCSSYGKTSLTFRVSRLLFLKSRLNLENLVYIRSFTTYFSKVRTYFFKSLSNFWKFRLVFRKVVPETHTGCSSLENHVMLSGNLQQHFHNPVSFFKKQVSPLPKQVVLSKILTIFLRSKPKGSECMSGFSKVCPVFPNLCRTLLNVCRTPLKTSRGFIFSCQLSYNTSHLFTDTSLLRENSCLHFI